VFLLTLRLTHRNHTLFCSDEKINVDFSLIDTGNDKFSKEDMLMNNGGAHVALFLFGEAYADSACFMQCDQLTRK